MTAIVGGWDSESELAVDGQVGNGPKSGSGGKVEGAKAGGPGLYMIEPSGLYWVGPVLFTCCDCVLTCSSRVTMVPPLEREDKLPRPSLRS